MDTDGPAPANLPPPAPPNLATLRLDPRVITWENLAHLAGAIHEALTGADLEARRRGHPLNLDEPCLLLVTDNPHVLGETGKVVERGEVPTDTGDPGRVTNLCTYTVRQALNMAELVNDSLAAAALEAHQAYAEAGIRPPGADG